MPPGRRPIPSEDERRIAEKEARFRALVEAGLTRTNVPGPGIVESIGSAIYGPVIDKFIQSLEPDIDAAIRREGTRARINAVQQPIDYYTALPDLKAAVLADMAMGIQRSADAEEGIREQRMANAPSVFPTDWANRQSSGYYPTGINPEEYPFEVMDDLPTEVYVSNPYETTGANEKPRFIIGNITQETIEQRNPIDQRVFNTTTNYQDEALRKLNPGEAILVTLLPKEGATDRMRTDRYEIVYPTYLVVAKDDEGTLFQREVSKKEYNNYIDAMRSGLPVDIQGQLTVDQIASPSMQAYARQRAILDSYPYSSRARQITYVSPETMEGGPGSPYGGVAAFVQPGESDRNITATTEYIPQDNKIAEELRRQGLIGFLLNNQGKSGEMVLTHEQGHVWDLTAPIELSDSPEYENAAIKDSRVNAKYAGKFEPFAGAPGYLYAVQLGTVPASEYGQNYYEDTGGSYSEDFAERQALWLYSKREGGLGTVDGEVVTFEDLFPNSAKFFEKAMKARYGK